MSKSLSKALLGAIVAGAALLSLSIASWSMDHDPVRVVAYMTERLDLSEEQQVRVKH